jgi:hypothetical protein
MTVFVADIASYQHGLIPAALRPACVGLWVKCTQGTGYVNPDYAAWLTEAKQSGLITAAYHYVDGSDPRAQAVNLKAHIGDATVPVMLDLESASLQQALAVADAATALGLHVKLLYLARSYWQSIGAPDLSKPLGSRGIHLIEASYRSMAAGATGQLYPGDSASEWAAYGGVTPALLQFTATAELAGQLLDCNAYRGTAAELAALLQTGAVPSPQGDTMQWSDDINGIGGRPTGNRVDYILTDLSRMRDHLYGDSTAPVPAGSPLAQLLALPAAVAAVEAQVGKLAIPAVDATALATALAGNKAFVQAIAHALAVQLHQDTPAV